MSSGSESSEFRLSTWRAREAQETKKIRPRETRRTITARRITITMAHAGKESAPCLSPTAWGPAGELWVLCRGRGASEGVGKPTSVLVVTMPRTPGCVVSK